MKKVTLTFIVEDSIADDVQNELGWGEMGNAAEYLNRECYESDYDIKDYLPSREGRIEVLYATDIEDGTKIMVLAKPYKGELSKEFAKKNLQTFFGVNNIDEEVVGKVCNGEEFRCDGYEFGWEEVLYEG